MDSYFCDEPHSVSCQCTFVTDEVPKDWEHFMERMQEIGVWRTSPPILESTCPMNASYFYIFNRGACIIILQFPNDDSIITNLGTLKDQLEDFKLFERLIRDWYRGDQVQVYCMPKLLGSISIDRS